MTGCRSNASSGSIRSTNGCPTRPRCSTSAGCLNSTAWPRRSSRRSTPGSPPRTARRTRTGNAIPEMSSTQKGGHWHFGMKTHIGVDAKSGLVHTVRTTTASVHDSQVFSELMHGEEEVVAGDSAYAHQMLKTSCRQAGVIYLIHDKASRGQSLSARQHHRNRHRSNLRSKVEVFLPHHQTAVGPRRRPLPRPGQEHRPAPPALRALEPLLGPQNPARRRLSQARTGSPGPQSIAQPSDHILSQSLNHLRPAKKTRQCTARTQR